MIRNHNKAYQIMSKDDQKTINTPRTLEQELQNEYVCVYRFSAKKKERADILLLE